MNLPRQLKQWIVDPAFCQSVDFGLDQYRPTRPALLADLLTRVAQVEFPSLACDCDWPPTTSHWEADSAYIECLAQATELEKQLPEQRVKRWRKEQHFARFARCFSVEARARCSGRSPLQQAALVRTMYGMSTPAEERVELRAPAGRKRKWLRAAERAGVSLSSWARRHLDQIADEELGTDEEPVPPSTEDIRAALGVAGALKGSGLRRRVHAARETPWTVG